MERPWHNFTDNIMGKVRGDHSFILKPKFTLMAIEVFNIAQSLSRIEGNLEFEGDRTIINILVRPNYMVLFGTYIFGIGFIYQVFSLDMPFGIDVLGLMGVFAFFIVGIFAAILSSMDRLRKRFERIMRIKRVDILPIT